MLRIFYQHFLLRMISRVFRMNPVLDKITYGFAGKAYDLAVIGGGPGGYVASIKASQLGLKTVCIEKRGSLGGTCLNVGCIPSKALLNISHKYEDATKHFKSFGLEVQGGVKVNWPEVQKKKDKIVTGLTSGIEFLFKKNKTDYIKGAGRITGKDSIEVKTSDGKTESITAKNILIATGSEPTPFPNLPFDEKTIISSTGALALPAIPKELIVVGGGVIGLEMGSVYTRLGSKVTVVEFLDQICPSLDLEIAGMLNKILTKQGMKIVVSHKVLSGKNLGNSAEITIEPVKGGEKVTLKADHVLIGTGRRPYTEGLGLKELGVKMSQRGQVEINEHFQTNVANIYAIGDVVRGAMLAHKAEEEGIACVEHIAGKGGHVNYNAIPSVVYTHPEVSCVGRTEEELKKDKVEYKKGVFPMMANSRAKTNDDADGLIKVLSCKKTDKILGVHMICAGAGELISEATLGIEYGASSEDLGRTCHAHPTLSEAVKEACMAAYDKPIHY